MVTKCHDIASRLITTDISKGSLGSCLVSTDVGSADEHCMQHLQIPVTVSAESRVPPAWIFARGGYLRPKMGMVLACSQGMGPVTCNFQA